MNRLDFIISEGRLIITGKDLGTLEECFVELDRIFIKEDRELCKRTSEDDMLGMLHFGLGTSLRNKWRLWGGPEQENSKLRKYFLKLGICHADDMTGIIFASWYRYLNNKPLELEKQVAFYKKYWKKMKVTPPNEVSNE